MASDGWGAILRQVDRLYRDGPAAGLSTAELLRRFARRRDELAFEALVARLGPMVLGVCRRTLGDGRDAEDAFQATFLVLARRAGSIRDPERLGPWLHGVARRVAGRARLLASRRAAIERPDPSALAAAAGPGPSPSDLDLRGVLDEEIARLPDPLRTAVLLCLLEGLPQAEAAARLGATPDAIRGRLERARRRLRDRLARRGLAPSAALAAIEGEADAGATVTVPPGWIEAAARLATMERLAAVAARPAALTLAEATMTAIVRLKLTTAAAALLVAVAGLVMIPSIRGQKADDPRPIPTAAPKPPAADAEPAGLTLTIVDAETGRPMPGLTLKWSAAKARAEATTDADGLARFPAPPNDRATVIVSILAEGYVPTRWVWVPGPTRPMPRSETVRLPKGTAIAGRLVDEAARPVAGASVFLLVPDQDKDSPIKPNLWDHEETTGADGRWRCEHMPPDLADVWIRLAHPDFVADSNYNATAIPNLEQLREGGQVMVMKAGHAVAGRVLDADGRPIEGASVVQGRDIHGSHPHTARTDADGRFRFPHEAAGELILTVQAAGHAPEIRTLQVPADDDLEFRLGPGGVVRGRVVDAEGRPVASALVVVDGWEGYRTLDIRTQTDAEGRFRLEDLPPAEVQVQVAASGFLNSPGHPLAPSDEEATLSLIRPLTIRGSVVDAETGEPIEAFLLVPGDDPRLERPDWRRDDARAHRGGRYEIAFDWPYPEVRSLRVEAEGYLPANSPGFAVTAGDRERTHDFRLVRGEVPKWEAVTGDLRRPDGTPAAEVEVILATATRTVHVRNGRVVDQQRDPIRTRTGPDGAFTFPPQEEKGIVLVLDDLGHAQATESELAQAGGSLTLMPWGRVAGEIRSGSGVLPSGEVRLQPSQPPNEHNWPIHYDYGATADDRGRFTIERVVPGSVRLSRAIETSPQTISMRLPWQVAAVEPGATTSVAIGGGGRDLIGRLIQPEGGARVEPFGDRVRLEQPRLIPPPPPEGLTVEQRQEWRRAWSMTPEGQFYQAQERDRRSYPVKVEPDGRFRIEDVLPGDYNLLMPPGGAGAPIEWSVHVPDPEGESGPLDLGDLTLPPG